MTARAAAFALDLTCSLFALGASAASLQQDFVDRYAKTPGAHVAPAMQYRVLKSGPSTGHSPTRTSADRFRSAPMSSEMRIFKAFVGVCQEI
jgi:hypothetical protein